MPPPPTAPLIAILFALDTAFVPTHYFTMLYTTTAHFIAGDTCNVADSIRYFDYSLR